MGRGIKSEGFRSLAARTFFNAHWDHEPPSSSPSPPREERAGERRPLLPYGHSVLGKAHSISYGVSHSPPTNRSQSGRGQPHSKTLPRRITRYSFREVLECGCPLPLFFAAVRTSRSVPWPHPALRRLGSPYFGCYEFLANLFSSCGVGLSDGYIML
jgi:hypothetical protein